jgi:hypothetical protein
MNRVVVDSTLAVYLLRPQNKLICNAPLWWMAGAKIGICTTICHLVWCEFTLPNSLKGAISSHLRYSSTNHKQNPNRSNLFLILFTIFKLFVLDISLVRNAADFHCMTQKPWTFFRLANHSGFYRHSFLFNYKAVSEFMKYAFQAKKILRSMC